MTPPTPLEPLMLSVAQAARLLGIGEQTARDLINRGEFPVPVRKLGGRMKVSRIQLERYAAGEDAPAPLRSIGGAA